MTDGSSAKTRFDRVARRWGLLPVLDLYMLREYLIPLSLLIMGFIFLFLIGDLFNDLKDFLENEATTTEAIRFFMLKLPGNIRFILPLSVLLACMYTMANMGKNHEITAMRACGISIMRACGSIFAVSLVVTGINFWFNEALVPYMSHEAYVLKKTVNNRDFKFELYNMLTYRSPDDLRTWLFKSFSIDGVQKNIILKKYQSDNRKLDWDLKAGEARFIPQEGWIFKDAVLTPYNKEGFMPGSSQKFDVLKKSIEEIPETPKEIQDMSKPPEDLPSWDIMRLLARTEHLPENLSNIYNTIFYYRIAFPWACFLAVFLGIPLASKNARGGVMGSIVKAVIVIVIYQLASEGFLVFGKRGLLPPIVAGLGPTIAFIIYGWYSVKKQV